MALYLLCKHNKMFGRVEPKGEGTHQAHYSIDKYNQKYYLDFLFEIY